ncbi:MAG: hypothetical protein HC912_05150 [Saprospiraceae bacterium]|nr:hypothetical protein [Saprospiraceae bacterium]
MAFGNPLTGIKGVGITSLRSALFEHFQEQWGYDFRVRTFKHYQNLGDTDHVLFVGYPKWEHRDTTHYCEDIPSELFANLYEPIWDDGSDGTPYNDQNHYVAYLYKTVSLYKEYVKFWEIWNEPDYSFSPNSIYAPGVAGNWWENNPNPCDYDIHAPIFHYIRMLRISYEVIKSVDPTAYVAIGGIGYPSFLDVVLRNTDNPEDGSVNEHYPLGGGAYFDVLSYHVYPHIDASLRTWNNEQQKFNYKRNTDEAVKGVIRLKDRFQAVLDKYGYNGEPYPEKEWIITESNVPRKPLNGDFGSDEVQRNFIIKALVESQKHNIKQFHIYTLGDEWDYEAATQQFQEYQIMGLYDKLTGRRLNEIKANDVGLAYQTCSKLLYKKKFDAVALEALKLPEGINGGAFRSEIGEMVYVLWAETTEDQSEAVNRTLNLTKTTGVRKFVQKYWHTSQTQDSSLVEGKQIQLTGAPIFLVPVENNNTITVKPYQLDVFPNPFTVNLNITLDLEMDQKIYLSITDQFGQVVKTIVADTWVEAGRHTWELSTYDFRDGVYFLEYTSNVLNTINRVLLIKRS